MTVVHVLIESSMHRCAELLCCVSEEQRRNSSCSGGCQSTSAEKFDCCCVGRQSESMCSFVHATLYDFSPLTTSHPMQVFSPCELTCINSLRCNATCCSWCRELAMCRQQGIAPSTGFCTSLSCSSGLCAISASQSPFHDLHAHPGHSVLRWCWVHRRQASLPEVLQWQTRTGPSSQTCVTGADIHMLKAHR